jgi:hypothetical protein
MPRTRHLGAALLAALLLVAAPACGSSSGDDDATPTTAAASTGDDPANGDAPTEDPGTDDPATDDPGTDEPAAEGECLTDSNQLSGSSTVVWEDGEIAPDKVLTLSAGNALDPSTLTVAVGERFGVENATDGLAVIKIGCAGGQTVPAGMTPGFVIDAPGTYVILDEAADGYVGAEIGSVTVE